MPRPRKYATAIIEEIWQTWYPDNSPKDRRSRTFKLIFFQQGGKIWAVEHSGCNESRLWRYGEKFTKEDVTNFKAFLKRKYPTRNWVGGRAETCLLHLHVYGEQNVLQSNSIKNSNTAD